MPATPTVVLDGVAFAHGPTPVFASLDLAFTPGWTGLVGPNGAGKTTLLRLLAGALRPDAGRIRRTPADLTTTWLVQVPDLPSAPAAVAALAARDDRDAVRQRAALRLDPADVARWPTLSPGERRRWQLAAALDAPDVLLLDEPEGHLDADGRALLVGALRAFRGVGVLVAHDRALLDAVTTATVELRAGRARAFPGPWSAATAAWDAEHEAALATREHLKDARAEARASLDRARREALAASRQTSAGRRMKSRHDSDARSVLATTQAAWAARALERGVARQAATVDRIDRALADTALPRRLDPKALALVLRPAPQRVLMGGHWDALTAGGRTLARDLTLWLARGDRVHLAGANGAGKTTLLRALLATATVAPDLLLVQPQELAPADTAAILADLRAAPPDLRGRTLALVAALGAAPERLLASDHPSPGEARKLHLALGLARGVAALVLDEPTNHLDLPSIARLEDALAAWPGALLLVTHDARLAARATTTRWTLADGRVTVRGVDGPDDANDASDPGA